MLIIIMLVVPSLEKSNKLEILLFIDVLPSSLIDSNVSLK